MVSVYLETSFISACVSDRRDATSVCRRGISREWWATQAHRYDRFVSAEVVAELSHPDFPRRHEAIELVEDVPLLPITGDVQGLAALLVHEKVMPGPLAGDAVHVAVATVHGMDYILTWNVRHLANPSKVAHLRTICLRMGLLPPLIITPEFLWEENHETD
jgi:predicted nucleic acid-binding protein